MSSGVEASSAFSMSDMHAKAEERRDTREAREQARKEGSGRGHNQDGESHHRSAPLDTAELAIGLLSNFNFNISCPHQIKTSPSSVKN